MDIDQEYEIVQIDDGGVEVLKEHPQNPNRGNEGLIDESLEANGWYGAVVAQRSTGYILAGNHRYRRALKKGATAVPVIWKDVDDEAALRIMLVDNKSTRDGRDDEEALSLALESLESLEGTGYGLPQLVQQEEAESAPEEASEEQDEGDVPEDAYAPQYGVMLVCDSEEQQEAIYETIQEMLLEDEQMEQDRQFQGVKLRVIAV